MFQTYAALSEPRALQTGHYGAWRRCSDGVRGGGGMEGGGVKEEAERCSCEAVNVTSWLKWEAS